MYVTNIGFFKLWIIQHLFGITELSALTQEEFVNYVMKAEFAEFVLSILLLFVIVIVWIGLALLVDEHETKRKKSKFHR